MNVQILNNQLQRKISLFIFLLALSGCSATGEFVSNTIEQIKDLDYYLGHKKLDEGEKPDGAAGDQYMDAGYMSVADGINPIMENPATACLKIPDPRFSYRKKVAFLALHVDEPQAVVDLNEIHQRLPFILSKRFNRDNFVVIDATHQRIPTAEEAGTADLSNYVRHMANQLNVQFLVTGSIVNADYIGNTTTRVSAVKNIFTGSSMQQQRQLEMSLAIYDGTTGTLIDESQYQGSAFDKVSMVQKPDPLIASFKEDNYGNLLDTYLNHQSMWLEDTLTCLPMQARVTSVTGRTVTFATGTESLLVPGDKLKLLRRIQLQYTLSGAPEYRFEENGEVVVSQVYPNGALAQFAGGTPPYQVNQGDIVQAW